MKSTTYKITMSSGQRVDMPAQSAGEAIEQALRKHRGLTVAECYSGLTSEDAKFISQTSDKKAMPGFINHEIPPHEPIPEDAVFKRVKREDHTAAMFDEADLIAESARAKYNRDRVVG